MMDGAKDFLSYSRQDIEIAELVRTYLRVKYKHDLWMDVHDIPPGEHWDLTIQKALQAATQIVVIFTRNSVASPNVWDEWAYMLANNKPVIPLLFDKRIELPYRLSRVQYINFCDPPYSQAFETLHKQLRRNLRHLHNAYDLETLKVNIKNDLDSTQLATAHNEHDRG